MPKTLNTRTAEVAPANLKIHPRNVNQGDLGAVIESIRVNGFWGRVVVNERTGYICAGNHRVMAAKELGFATVPVEYVDVDDETELRILVADNRTTRLGDDDPEGLAALLSELANTEGGLPGTGFDGDDLDDLIARLAGEAGIGGTELLTAPDEIPDNAPTRCKAGDMWKLGRHRLLCGDSTKREDVARLMGGNRATFCFTSPPYNASEIDQEGNDSTKRKYVDTKDDRSEAEYSAFLIQSVECILSVSDICFYNIQVLAKNRVSVVDLMAHFRNQFKDIVYWVKNTGTPHIQPGVMNSWVEVVLCFSSELRPSRAFATAQFSQGTGRNIVQGATSSGNEYSTIHKATFPEYLPRWFIENFSASGQIVLDAFGGTGTTLIACESMGRSCYALELSPTYCDVILTRWENATGQKAELLEEADNGNSGT